jgi:glucose-6-phosphate isomerase
VYGSLAKRTQPKLFFLDTIDPDKLVVLKELFEEQAESASDVVVNVISKSGTTTETVVNAEALYALLSEMFGNMSSQVVVTTDEGSALWDLADSYGFLKLPIPVKVGGRFSVFSPVGLFPLGLAGISIRELLEGARSMRNLCLEGVDTNPALVTASTLYQLHTEGCILHNSFFFSPRMESVGKWYRQLMGESLGKEHNTDGEVVHEGIVPVVSIGSTDLHSMAQLYFGGPRIFFSTLVSVQDGVHDEGMHNSTHTVFAGLLEDIEGKSQYDVMQSISGGVAATYKKLFLPHMSIVFPELSAFSLGQFLQYNMMMIAYLAKLLKVNAFDQPNVEAYKIETRRLLRGEEM